MPFTPQLCDPSHLNVKLLVLLRFQKFCRRSVLVGFARKTAVVGSVSVLSAYGHIVLQLSSSQVRTANNRIHAIMHSKKAMNEPVM